MDKTRFQGIEEGGLDAGMNIAIKISEKIDKFFSLFRKKKQEEKKE